jgi:hypothetical protein
MSSAERLAALAASSGSPDTPAGLKGYTRRSEDGGKLGAAGGRRSDRPLAHTLTWDPAVDDMEEEKLQEAAEEEEVGLGGCFRCSKGAV